jgi:hypothetical protein
VIEQKALIEIPEIFRGPKTRSEAAAVPTSRELLIILEFRTFAAREFCFSRDLLLLATISNTK